MISFRRLVSRARGGLWIVGGVAFTLAALAAVIAAATLVAPQHRDGPGEGARNGPAGRPGAALAFPAADYRQTRFPRVVRQPLLGANYTHYSFRNCSFNGTGILRAYSRPGVAREVHSQLSRMRKAGVATIRTIIWHMTDATGQTWGPVPSAGGRLTEPYRTHLIRYLREVRRFGFARLTVSMGPQQANNPLLTVYEPGRLQENWRFIRTIRALLKRHGPRDTRIDLLNEGAPSEMPSEWSPVPWQTAAYLRTLYRLYVKRFGNRDVSISTIAWDPTHRMRNLIRVLKSTGQPMPRWYDVHVGYTPAQASDALRESDRVLASNGLGQPLVVGETAYDNRGIARAVASFMQRSSRQIDEVSPWYVQTANGCQIRPPYTPGAYGRTLQPG